MREAEKIYSEAGGWNYCIDASDKSAIATIAQNQILLLEVLLDIRKLLEVKTEG